MSNDFPASTTAYCKSCALCLAFTTSKTREKTITLEFARSVASRKYDWTSKVGFELSAQEMAEVCAYLIAPWGTAVEMIHGTGPQTKRLTVANQTKRVLFSMGLGPETYRIPLMASDVYLFRNHLLSRLVEIQPELPPALHWRSLQQFAADMGR